MRLMALRHRAAMASVWCLTHVFNRPVEEFSLGELQAIARGYFERNVRRLIREGVVLAREGVRP